MKRFLRELEARLAQLTPEQRADVTAAYLALIRGVVSSTAVIGGHFKPSLTATLGLLNALVGAMGPGGGEKLVRQLKSDAQEVGPYVLAFVYAI